MRSSLANARRHQIIFAVLLAVCVAQVAWWMIDQWWFSADVHRRLEEAHGQSIRAAEVMLEQGLPPERVATMFPALVVADDGVSVSVAPEVIETLDDERWSRLNRYAWEGGFFFVVLSAAIGVLWSAVRTEARLRRRQHNFVTAVTHELKSPLASIRLSVETLDLRDADPETRQRLSDRLLTSLDRMEGTVSKVLDTARIDEGELTLQPETVDLATFVEQTIDSLDGRANSVGVKLEHGVPGDLTLRADPGALGSVLRNLITNGIDAAAGAPGAVVTISASAEPPCAVIEVRDNGRGFNPADAEKLFEKFYRLGDELRREGRGTGLGLYIARILVSQSGGELSAHSEGPGRGATFRVAWPLTPAGNSKREVEL